MEKKRGRGRPRKVLLGKDISKNVSTGSNVSEAPRKRGRPRKIRPLNEERDMPVILTKTYKTLGYCPKCQLVIGHGDLEKGKESIFICPKCGNRGKVKELKAEIDLGEKPKSKKEYLQTVNSIFNYNAFNDHIPIEKVEDVIEPDEEIIKSEEEKLIERENPTDDE